MKNVFKFLGIIALVALIIISIAACNKNKEQASAPAANNTTAKAVETSGAAAAVTWREEFMPGDFGYWVDSDGNKRLFFSDDEDFDMMGNPKERNTVSMWVDGSGYKYKLVSKDDKPAGQVSFFTIEDDAGEKYTVKYTLGTGDARIFTITDHGGLENFLKGTCIRGYYGHDDTGESDYYTGYLQQLEKARSGNATKEQIQELESAIAQLNRWWATSTTVQMKAAASVSYDYSKILKGDLSDFAGTCANGAGERKQLRADGTFANGQTASGFTTRTMTNGGTYYMWGVNSPEGGGFGVMLFPIGTGIQFGNEFFQTDKGKVRIMMGQDLDASQIFYLE